MDRFDTLPSTVLTRRQTLWAMAGIASLPSFLIGCGGGGHGGGGSSTSSANVAVTLPSGLTIAATDLQAGTAYGTGAVTNGSFKAKVSSKGPTFAYLQQKSTGKFLLFGYAGQGGTGVSAMGSAIVLLGTVLGVGLFPASEARALMSLIESAPATATLANVIEARVAADPYALTDGDAQIQAAVQTALASLGGTGSQAVHAKGVTRADPTPILSITPQDQSGSNVIQKEQSDAIIPVNEIRRPAAVYTYQTGTIDSSGTTTTFPNAVAFAGPQDLDPTTSITGSLATLGVRPAFAPVEGSSTTLKVYNDDVVKTLYETVILMASGKTDLDPDPSFFSDAKYASFVADWKTKRQELNTHAVFGAILFDLFSSVVGGLSTWVSYSVVAAAVADLEAASADAAQMVVRAATGDVPGATLRWFAGATDANAIASAPWKQSIAEILVKAEGFGETAVSAELLTAIGGLAAYIGACLLAAGTILGLGDVATSYKDVLTSDKADLWSETLLKPSVLISPVTGTVQAGGSLTLTAATPGTSETNYKFHWTLSAGGNGNLGDPTGAVKPGNNITTTGNSVNLATAASDTEGAIYTVTVEAIDLKTGASLGTATSTITVTATVLYIPTTLTTHQLSVTQSGYLVAHIYAVFTPVSGGESYGLSFRAGAGDPQGTPGEIIDIAETVYAKDLPVKDSNDGATVGNALYVTLADGHTQAELDDAVSKVYTNLSTRTYLARVNAD